MEILREFGRFFRNRRAALGLNLSEFCRKNGFDKGNISRLERGLAKPPESPELLESLANALQLDRDSEEWGAFMGHAAIARGKLPSAVSQVRAADVEEMIRTLGRRLHESWVKARHLENWSSTRKAQEVLPELVRRLVYASAAEPARIEMPGGEGQRHGWDGVVDSPKNTLLVPAGVSAWEMSVEQRPASKFESDFAARKKGPLGLPASEVTFIFVTSRKFDGKQKRRDEKRGLGKWKNVEIYDSADLELWLELAPGVDAWMAEQLGLRPAGVMSISEHWESLSQLTEPRLKPEIFLASRRGLAKILGEFLVGTAGVMALECRSPVEAVDFVAAYLALTKTADKEVAEIAMEEHDRTRARSRTVVVRDRSQWEGLAQATGPLTLIGYPSLALSAEDLNAAVRRGHRAIIAATQFSNHRLQAMRLPRPSRFELREALRRSGFEKEKSDDAARAAGGSLSVLKRQLSVIPDSRLPDWCNSADVDGFMPMLLIGAWDEASAVDRAIISRLSGRPYPEIQNVASRLAKVDEAPLARFESRWRLVSPEDSWSLVGRHVTDDQLALFETIAIEVLGQENDAVSASFEERLKTSLAGTSKPIASTVLRRGVSETTAILGAGFGPVAELSKARERSAKIVRASLKNATWLKWATLGDVLPLLAEAAPREFLNAVSADLERESDGELTKLLADDAEEYPWASACKHAGLLWALEALAWSPEWFSKACDILANLCEVDTGRKWGNRPGGSLVDIFLTWYPQTAAKVEQRVAALKSLAKHRPAVAWNLLFSLLPQVRSTTMPTHRPIWRDWVSAWQEGVSDADDWKQVEATGHLIVQLIGNDAAKWHKVLDQLQAIPEDHRNQLIERLRGFAVDELDTEDRRRLAEHLRKTIRHHRDFADARWALPKETVDQLEQALSRFVPDVLIERHAWLFAPWVELEGFMNNYGEMEAELARRRAASLSEIVDREGLEGVSNLADIVESPGQVGATLAATDCSLDAQFLRELLTKADANRKTLAANYVWARIRNTGWDWVRALRLETWSGSDAATLLGCVGMDPDAWTFAKALGNDIWREYWRRVAPANGFLLRDQRLLEFASQRLLEAGRAQDAVLALSPVTLGKFDAAPSSVMEALTACRDTELHANTLSVIQRLFTWLQEKIRPNEDELTRRLGELEWRYLQLLDGFDARPSTLIYCVSEDPKFFARLISLVFRPKDVPESDVPSTDEQQQRASHGYRLLMNWNRVPGTQSDGSIDEEQLLRWLEAARSLCRASGHLEVADLQIGEMLGSWPRPKDESTMWPCVEICDAIEEVDSDDLDQGFQIGAFNSRGVVVRSPLMGGDAERKEGAKYRRWAELCDADWPRTAASLRSIADSYEFDAQREDVRAAERAQDRR